MDTERLNVAITGQLSETRSVVGTQIDATRSGHFVESLTLSTHSLVCEKYDSKKARKAALYATAVIFEAGLREIMAAGEFPGVALRPHSVLHPSNFPEIEWTEMWVPAQRFILTYRDALGNVSTRTILATGRGLSNGHSWLGVYDGPSFKIFRDHRTVEMNVHSTLLPSPTRYVMLSFEETIRAAEAIAKPIHTAGYGWANQDALKQITVQAIILRTGRSDACISEKLGPITECAGALYRPRKADKWGVSEPVKERITIA